MFRDSCGRALALPRGRAPGSSAPGSSKELPYERLAVFRVPCSLVLSFCRIDSRINVDAMIHDRYVDRMALVQAGLDGVVAAATALSDVDGERGELTIAGYPLQALAAHATFEETTWLLWHGALPTAAPTRRLPRGAGGGPAAGAGHAGPGPRVRWRRPRRDGHAAHRRRDDLARRRRRRGWPEAGVAVPRHRRRLLAAAARPGAGRAAPDAGPRRQLPLHARRHGARSRARARPGDLPQHRGGPRPERVDVHRAGDHLDRIGPGVGRRRRPRRAEGPAPRRRARAGPRHGVRDRRRVARRGGAARRSWHAARS